MKEDIIDSTISTLNAVNIGYDEDTIKKSMNYINTHTIPETANKCIICGEGVALTEDEMTMLEYGKPIPPKVCDKCKQAIIRMRNYIQAEDFLNSLE